MFCKISAVIYTVKFVYLCINDFYHILPALWHTYGSMEFMYVCIMCVYVCMYVCMYLCVCMYVCITWCFSDLASWIDYILITNLMHWLLFIHKILFSSTCFEPQVLIFRRIQLYTSSICYCHSLWEFVVACRYTAWVKINNNQCIKLIINI